MPTFRLDVNVLIALADPAHIEHEPAHDWFEKAGSTPFATCPLTENGLLRILRHPRYPNSPGTPAAAGVTLAALRGLPGHHFWADKISLMDGAALTWRACSATARSPTAICWRSPEPMAGG